MRDALLLALLALPVSACSAPGESGAPAVVEAGLSSMTIDSVFWSDDPRLPASLRGLWGDEHPSLVAHVVEWPGFAALKAFTRDADKQFALEADGRPRILVRMATGGTTSPDGQLRYVHLMPPSSLPLDPPPGTKGIDRSVDFRLTALNRHSSLTWIVDAEVPAIHD